MSNITDDYVNLLSSRYNQPERSLFALVAEALKGIADPAEAWRVLKESNILPSNLFRDEHRHFADGVSLKSSDRFQEKPQPSTIGSILSIASDLGGIGAAEAYAKELSRALMPWKATCNDQIVWHFMDRPIDGVVYLGLAYNSARDTVNWTLDECGIDLDSLQPSKDVCPLPLIVRNCLGAWRGWNIAVEKDLEIQQPRWPLDVSKYRFFKHLSNPFESLLKLWCTGHLIYCDYSTDDPFIRLYTQQVAPVL